jgi:hypothetical protein
LLNIRTRQSRFAPQHVQEVVAADRQAVAVAGHDPDVKLRVGELDTGGDRQRAAMDGVVAVGLDVVRKPAGASDPGHAHGVFRARADLRQRALHGFQNRIVAATGHQRTSWSETKSSGASSTRAFIANSSSKRLGDGRCDLGDDEGLARHFVQRSGIDQIGPS